MVNLKSVLDSKPPKNNRFYTIAIDGRGGAGKSSFTKYLQDLLPDFTFLYYDDYFEPLENKEAWGGFNRLRFEQDVISPLKDGGKIIYRPYDWHKQPPISERVIDIGAGLVLEGCFSFEFDLDWDLKVWIETPRELCLQRGVERDQKNTGYEHAMHVWRDVWLPPEDEYIRKIKPLQTANTVLDGTKDFAKQLV